MPSAAIDTNAVEGPTEAQPKLTNWAKEPNLRELKKDLELARPDQQAHVQRIQKWRDNLNIEGSAVVATDKGRSSVQPRLIRKQAEWRYSSLSEPFLSAEKVFSVNPTSWEDLDAAEQNEVLLNWQFRTKLNFVKFIDDYVHRVVDEGSVVVRVGWERETKTETVTVPVYEFYPVPDPEQMQQLQTAMELQETNPAEFDQLPDELKEAVSFTLENQTPVVAVVSDYEEVEQEKVLKNHPTVEVVETCNFIYDTTCKGDLSKAMFQAYTYEVTRGDLERDSRYKNLDKVRWDVSPLTEPDVYTPSPREINFEERSRQKVWMTEYYGLYDIEGDGHLTPILMCWIGDTVVRLEENPFPDNQPPFVIIPYMPIKDQAWGEPDGEILEDNQKILGAVTRGIIDTLARSANGQRGMAKGMLDVTNRKRYEAGKDYDFNPNMHPSTAVIEHTYPEIPASAFNMTQMQNMEAEALTGVKTFDDGLNSSSLGKVAAGIRGALEAANRREMSILRRLSKGMEEIGAKILAMNQMFLTDEEVVRITNKKFVRIRRDDIQGRFDMDVQISTAGEDEAKAARLEFMLQTLGNSAPWEATQMILGQIAKLRKMPTLAHMLENYQPEPDPLAVAKAELEVEELRAKVQKAESEAIRARADAEYALARARLAGSEADLRDLDFVEQESGTKHARDVDKQQAQAQGNIQLEIAKGVVRAATEPRTR